MITSKQKFNSRIQELDKFALQISDSVIKNEPMFFNCSLNYAFYEGGPITKEFIKALPINWRKDNFVFDSRVHMLMPGWFPCIPGYHHDDIPRLNNNTGQPNYNNPEYYSEHILGVVNADICPTEFALGECTMPSVKNNEIVYKKWHLEIEKLITANKLVVKKAEDRTLYAFDWQTFHTGTKAVANSWRWFGRVSRNTDRTKHITNEIRVNSQVYLEFPMEGW